MKFKKWHVVSCLIIFIGLNSCSKDEELVLEVRTLQSALNNGESIPVLLNEFSVQEFYGVTYLGGLVFHIDEVNKWGLIAAPKDQHDSIVWWNGTFIFVPSSLDLGFGGSNTQSIVDSQGVGGYAAYFCDTMFLNGYSDWYLPSRFELESMHQNLYEKGIGDFFDLNYWSSTDVFVNTSGGGISLPAAFYFSIGVHTFHAKDNFLRVRAARKFNF